MYQIIVNGSLTQIGEVIPTKVTGLTVTYRPNPLQRVVIHKSKVVWVKKWFNQLIDSCSCEWVVYNNVYILTDDLQKFGDV